MRNRKNLQNCFNAYPHHDPKFKKTVDSILNSEEFQTRLKQANDFLDKMAKLLREK